MPEVNINIVLGMLLANFLSFLCVTIVSIAGYDVDITVIADGVEEQIEYEVTDTEMPPFETMAYVTEGSQDQELHFGPVASGYLGNTRGKRSLPNGEVCIKNGDKNEEINKAIAVEIGETLHLPCHACNEGADEKFESMQWTKLDPFPNPKGMYHVREILSDMHDDESRNRIVIDIDHTLVIKRTNTSDSGSYFCTRANEATVLDKMVSWRELQNWQIQKAKLRYYFLVDVLDLTSEKFIDVSEYSSKMPKTPEYLHAMNIVIDTLWHPWSDCSVCGEDGLRKRIGVCVVKKLDKSIAVPNVLAENVLKISESGLPCHSEFLRHVADEQLDRPIEVQIEECFVPCQTTNQKRRRRSISKSELLTGQKKEKGSSKEISVRDGEYLILVCPGSSLTSLAVWVNGTKNIPLMRLRKQTNTRISFDPLGNLLFSPVALSDNGVYSCWIKKKKKRKFVLSVKVNYTGEMVQYMVYLCYVFIADFVMFFIFSCVKMHRLNRNDQRRRKRKSNDTMKDETASLLREKNNIDNEMETDTEKQ